MKKRGFSHVEAILSFLLFIGFLTFAFFFFSPFSGNRVLDSSIVYASNEVSNNVTTGLESYSIVIDENTIENVVRLDIDTSLSDVGVRVENSQGEVVDSKIIVIDDMEQVYFDRSSDRFFVVMFNENFSVGDLAGDGSLLIEGVNYTISSSEKREVLSEARISALKVNYENDYVELKKNFNLPNRIDFSFILEFNFTDKILTEREIPESLEVISVQERVEVVREDGRITFANLITKVW